MGLTQICVIVVKSDLAFAFVRVQFINPCPPLDFHNAKGELIMNLFVYSLQSVGVMHLKPSSSVGVFSFPGRGYETEQGPLTLQK